jgi:hypothetical protein
MNRLTSTLLLLAFMSPAMAWQEDTGPATAEPAGDAPTMARIITHSERPAQCLSRVHIRQIDGEEKIVHDAGFEIEPGRHTMNGTAVVNTSFCRYVRGSKGLAVPDLEADFEAGKTYYIGLDHSSKNFNDWRLVIWKVEPEEEALDG